MTHDADLIRQLSDYFLGSVWVNTRYLHQRPVQVPSKQVSLHTGNTGKVLLPSINLLPMQHEGKTYLKLQMRYHKPLYGVLFQTAGVKWSRSYRCFITHLCYPFARGWYGFTLYSTITRT